MRLPASEEIARAVCTEHFVRETGGGSPSLYKGVETSVSRLAIFPLDQHWSIFAKTVQKLPGRRVERIAQIGVGTIESIRHAHNEETKSCPVLFVEDAPDAENPAHAVIKPSVSKGRKR